MAGPSAMTAADIAAALNANPSLIGPVQSALAQGNGLTASTAAPGSALDNRLISGQNVAASTLAPNSPAAAQVAPVADLVLSRQRRDYLAPVRSQVIQTGLPNVTSSPAAGGWNYANANLSVESVDVRRKGVPVLKVAAPGTGTMVIRSKIPVVTGVSKAELWVKLPEQSAGYVQLYVTYSSDTPAADPPTARPTNYRRINVGSDSLQYGSWFPLTLGTGANGNYSTANPNGVAWSTTGSPDATEIEYLEIEYLVDATTPLAERYFLLDQVAVNGKGRPMLMLGFDGIPDASASIDGGAMLGKTRALFAKYGFRGYIAQNSENVNGTQKPFHDDLYGQGWDICQQGGVGHNDHALMTYAQVQQSIQNGLTELKAGGYTRCLDWMMYPFNSRNLNVDAAAASMGIRAQREFRKPGFVVSSLGRQNLFRIGSYDAGQKTAVQMQGWIDDAIAKGESINIYTHIMRTSASSSVETTFSEYATFLAYVASKYYAGQIDVVTPSEFLSTQIAYPTIP